MPERRKCDTVLGASLRSPSASIPAITEIEAMSFRTAGLRPPFLTLIRCARKAELTQTNQNVDGNAAIP